MLLCIMFLVQVRGFRSATLTKTRIEKDIKNRKTKFLLSNFAIPYRMLGRP